MTKAQLYTLTTNLLGGYQIDADLFTVLLNMKKGQREMSRDWVVLRSHDASISFSASDTYLSTKALPARFLRLYEPYAGANGRQPGVFIVDNAGTKHPLVPVKFADRATVADVEGFFYLDMKNRTIGRTGALAGTLHLYFLEATEDLDEDTEWSFPDYAHPLLAYDVAVEHKGGIDWDTINANQVPFNVATVRSLESSLAMWDARLQQQELGV
jgi:hypothetical protein